MILKFISFFFDESPLLLANRIAPDGMPHTFCRVTSGADVMCPLGYCLPICSTKKDARLKFIRY